MKQILSPTPKALLKPCHHVRSKKLRSASKCEKASKLKSLMACPVSMGFSLPFSAPNTFFKELHSKKTVLVRPSKQSTCRAVTKLSTSCSITNAVSSTNRSCQNHLSQPLRQQWEIISYHMNVDSCSQMIISGYWVGPDVDDGWGYVEAFINPTI